MDTYPEWEALLARRRRHNASGQDGSDIERWKQSRGAQSLPQMKKEIEDESSGQVAANPSTDPACAGRVVDHGSSGECGSNGDIIQPVLTVEEVRKLVLEKIGSVTPALREDATELARAIESALLSKLRAPVAAEAAPDLRPHLEWALRLIWVSMETGVRYEAALEALDAAHGAFQAQAGPDLRPHLEWALRHIEKRLSVLGLGERYDVAIDALNAAGSTALSSRVPAA